jgi:hypothetical protein
MYPSSEEREKPTLLSSLEKVNLNHRMVIKLSDSSNLDHCKMIQVTEVTDNDCLRDPLQSRCISPHLRTEPDSVPETCFLIFGISEVQQNPETH